MSVQAGSALFLSRANAGFALFLAALLIAPGIPLPGFPAEASVSPAAGALVLWFLLAPELPVKIAFRSRLLLGLMLVAVYVFLVACLSGRFVAIAYAAQWLWYAVAAGALLPAYLILKARQQRLDEAWRIMAGIAGLYALGILFSLWWGPIYPHQVGFAIKHYGEVDLVRGVGFGEGANSAGGVMAVLAAFVLLVYRPRGRLSLGLALLCLAALAATMSRGAISALMIAFVAASALWALRLMVASRARAPRAGLRVQALWAALVIALFASFVHPLTSAAWQRLVLDPEHLGGDADSRLEHWSEGVESWSENDLAEQMLGAGFRSGEISSGGALLTSHNAYVEMLRDFGVAGLLLFCLILAIAIARAMAVAWRGQGLFPLVALVTMTWHSMTQVYWYSPVMVVLLVLAIGMSQHSCLARRSSALMLRSPRWDRRRAAFDGA